MPEAGEEAARRCGICRCAIRRGRAGAEGLPGKSASMPGSGTN